MKGIRDHLALFQGTAHPEGLSPAPAALRAWPNPAALLDAHGRLLCWNAAFAALPGMLGARPGQPVPPREGLLRRPWGQGLTLLEWDEEAAAMAEARRLCRGEAADLLLALRGRVAMGDLRGAAEAAHGLRGLAANFGLGALLPPLRGLEGACRAEDRGEARRHLRDVEDVAGPALAAL